VTIEFHCPHCDKLLKTPDDKAGVRANCPGCGQIITVPDLVVEAAQADPSFAASHVEAEVAPPEAGFARTQEDEVVDSDRQHDMKPCPMCGAAIKKAARRCRFCGETIVHHPAVGSWEPTTIAAGDVLGISWATFKDQFGVLFGSFLITIGVIIALAVVNQVIQTIITFAFVGAGGAGNGGNPLAFGFALFGVAFVLGIFNVAVQLYLEAGMTVVYLRVARGERVEVSEVFSGGRYFWRLLGVSLLMVPLVLLAYVIVLLPGIVTRDPTWSVVAAIPCIVFALYLTLRFWPVYYVIVDRDAGVIQALQDCPRATANNSLAVIVLALAALGVYLLGLLACIIGVLIAVPLIRLIFATAYCGMTGQLTSRRD